MRNDRQRCKQSIRTLLATVSGYIPRAEIYVSKISVKHLNVSMNCFKRKKLIFWRIYPNNKIQTGISAVYYLICYVCQNEAPLSNFNNKLFFSLVGSGNRVWVGIPVGPADFDSIIVHWLPLCSTTLHNLERRASTIWLSSLISFCLSLTGSGTAWNHFASLIFPCRDINRRNSSYQKKIIKVLLILRLTLFINSIDREAFYHLK